MKRSGPLRRRRKKRDRLELDAADRWISVVRRRPILRSITESVVIQSAGHHIIPQQTLEGLVYESADARAAAIWDVRNGLHVSRRRHERHHSGHERIVRSELPLPVFDFADELGLGWYLDRHYPKET